LVALEAYLGERSDLRGIAADMIEAARDLLGYASPILEVELPEPATPKEIEPEPDPTERSGQLRLL
jgi:hypothetical protein